MITNKFKNLTDSQQDSLIGLLCALQHNPVLLTSFRERVDAILERHALPTSAEDERPILVGSTWRNKRYGHLRTVEKSNDVRVCWVDAGGYRDTFDPKQFRDLHEWVSDPVPVSNVIRSGDLVVGKRYRIVEFRDANRRHAAGDTFLCIARDEIIGVNEGHSHQVAGKWFVGAEYAGSYVTAVELVDDEPESDPRAFEPMECCGRERDKDGGPNPHCECPAPARRDDCASCGDTRLAHSQPRNSGECSAFVEKDGIIRAAEGVVLEAGEYAIVEIRDRHAKHSVGDRFTVAGQLPPIQYSVWVWRVEVESDRERHTLVTSVRRVDSSKESPASTAEPSLPTREHREMAARLLPKTYQEGDPGLLKWIAGGDPEAGAWWICDCTVAFAAQLIAEYVASKDSPAGSAGTGEGNHPEGAPQSSAKLSDSRYAQPAQPAGETSKCARCRGSGRIFMLNGECPDCKGTGGAPTTGNVADSLYVPRAAGERVEPVAQDVPPSVKSDAGHTLSDDLHILAGFMPPVTHRQSSYARDALRRIDMFVRNVCSPPLRDRPILVASRWDYVGTANVTTVERTVRDVRDGLVYMHGEVFFSEANFRRFHTWVSDPASDGVKEERCGDGAAVPSLSFAEGVANLRVFHLSTELQAVSKEARDHAEVRAKLVDENKALLVRLEAAERERDEAVESADIDMRNFALSTAELEEQRERAEKAEASLERAEARVSELEQLPSGKYFTMVKDALRPTPESMGRATSWADLAVGLKTLREKLTTYEREAKAWEVIEKWSESADGPDFAIEAISGAFGVRQRKESGTFSGVVYKLSAWCEAELAKSGEVKS